MTSNTSTQDLLRLGGLLFGDPVAISDGTGGSVRLPGSEAELPNSKLQTQTPSENVRERKRPRTRKKDRDIDRSARLVSKRPHRTLLWKSSITALRPTPRRCIEVVDIWFGRSSRKPTNRVESTNLQAGLSLESASPGVQPLLDVPVVRFSTDDFCLVSFQCADLADLSHMVKLRGLSVG